MSNRSLKVCLDRQNHVTKPENIKEISLRIPKCCIDISIQRLAEQLVHPYGKTFIPCWFKEDEDGRVRRSNACWAGQTLFALDFDSGITVDEVLERCNRYNVMPVFIYSTFSSIDNNKFRVVFQISFEVRDIRVRNIIQLGLMALFKEADKSCKDPARLFYGGKELIYQDYEATLDVAVLVFSVCEHFSVTDEKNYATNIRRFCRNIGVNMFNGLPYVEIFLKDQFCKESSENLYIYNRKSRHSLQNRATSDLETVVIHFHETATKLTLAGLSQGKAIKFDVLEERKAREVVEKFDFEKLKEKCKLYAEFSCGEYWAHHNEIFGIATNLLTVKGGLTIFLEVIKRSTKYDSKKWRYFANYIHKMHYAPMRCSNFCPFADECKHAKNMIEIVKLKKGSVSIVEPSAMISLASAEEKVAKAVQYAVDSKENKVFVIKAPPGIGKTELYLGLENTTIAVPRHDLKKEVSERMKAVGNKHEVIPELPKENARLIAEITALHAKGYHEGASALVKERGKQDESIKEYLEEVERIKNSKGTLLTTHERLLFVSDNNDQIVIDEDIVPALLKIDKVSINDLVMVASKTKLFPTVIEKVVKAEIGVVQSVSWEFLWELSLDKDEYGRVYKQINHVSTNVIDFFNCSHWIRNNDGTISYICRRELANKKVIILSATANEYVYRLLFGDRLEFIDIGNVKTLGKIIQYPQWSFSRHQMDNEEKFLTIAKHIAGQQHVITHKRFRDQFSNCIANFGNTTGIDAYKGQDMVVIGTPHLNTNTYFLYASALSIDISGDNSLSDIRISRKGMEFYFNTFVNIGLREIQLYLIESELVQAIGRARLLRNDCTVTVLSRLPMIGAEFVYLSREEERKMLNRS